MSKYQPYPQYKDSGVEWLGEVPEHWEVKRLKYFTTVNDETLSEKYDEDFEINYIDIGSVTTGYIQNSEVILYSDAPSRARRIVREGDILVSTVRTYLKAIAPVPHSENGYIASTGFAVIRSRNDVCSDYLKYALLSNYFINLVESESTGISYPAINASELVTFNIALAPFEEQQVVANFLDNATCKIDTLIQKQQNLIELLKEKRQALISHTVTKGLNPDVKMKDSGVEWLREVPEHWESVCLKWIAKIYSGGTPDKTNLSYWEEGTIPWISSGEVNQFFITEPTTYITEEAYEKSSAKWIPKNALVMALAGQGKTKGMVAQLGIMTTCNQSMAAIVLSEKVSERFIFWWLTSNYEKIRNLAGGDLRDGLNLDIIGSIVCPYFLLSEQQQIANYLDNATCKINTLISKAQQAIELLKERRTALISATVTGKIDVRSSNGR